jgi:hypothetical protein
MTDSRAQGPSPPEAAPVCRSITFTMSPRHESPPVGTRARGVRPRWRPWRRSRSFAIGAVRLVTPFRSPRFSVPSCGAVRSGYVAERDNREGGHAPLLVRGQRLVERLPPIGELLQVGCPLLVKAWLSIAD